MQGMDSVWQCLARSDGRFSVSSEVLFEYPYFVHLWTSARVVSDFDILEEGDN